jgi:uncharacterized membrane protein
MKPFLLARSGRFSVMALIFISLINLRHVQGSSINAQPGFYRPPIITAEPRATENGLISGWGYSFAGRADSSFNAEGHKVALLPLEEPIDELKPQAHHHIDFTQSGFVALANLTKHFFLVSSLPYFSLRLVQTPLPQQAKQRDTALAAEEKKVLADIQGFGNLFFGAGVTLNKETTQDNAISATFTGGALLSTGVVPSLVAEFPLSLGFGASNGLTVRGTVGYTYHKKLHIGITSSIAQALCADIECFCRGEYLRPGMFYDTHLYATADNIIGKLSVKAGYIFQHQNKSGIFPAAAHLDEIQQNDPRLKAWESHTLALDIGYDFATKRHSELPRIDLFFHQIVAGKRVAASWMLGPAVSLSISTCF